VARTAGVFAQYCAPDLAGPCAATPSGDDLQVHDGPRAEAKIHDVVGLYLQPPTNAVVVSVDEKTQIQALSRTQPLLPLRPGLPRARPTTTSAMA